LHNYGDLEMRTNYFVISLLLLFIYVNSIAQNFDNWTNIKNFDGLIDNSVLSIGESNDGALWFGTQNGISKYEAGTWTNFTKQDGLIHNTVLVVCGASNGAVWFGTAEGVSCYHNNTWTPLNKDNSELIDNHIQAIFQSKDGSLWFGTPAGVSQFKSGAWNSYTISEGLIHDNVQAIYQTSDGAMWFGTKNGLSQLKNSTWVSHTTAQGLIGNNVQAILESSDNVLYVGTTNGVSKYINDLWMTLIWSEYNYPFEYNTTSICESRDGSLWFGSDDWGVRRYHNDKWLIYFWSQPLSSGEIRAIFESSYGAVWIGTSDGLSRYREPAWQTFTKDDGLISHTIYVVLAASDGTTWVGTEDGLSQYQVDIDYWTDYTRDNSELIDNKVYTMLESSDGALWFGTFGNLEFDTGGGVSQLHEGNWTDFTRAKGLVSNHVFAIYESRDSSIWFGCRGGISRLKDGEMKPWKTLAGGNYPPDVMAISESDDGAMWFAVDEGVRRSYNGSWEIITATNSGLINNIVTSIYKSSDGALWFGTFEGVSRFHHGDWKSYTTSDGLAHNLVREIYGSSDGAIWFGTEGAVSRFQDGVWETFSESTGLAYNIAYGIAESKDGIMWFGTWHGLTRLVPDRNPPFTFIDDGPENRIGTPTPMFIFHGVDYFTNQGDLSYSFAALESSIIPDSSHWSPYSKITATQPEFQQNGAYKFYVRAKDKWGNVDPTPATRTFTVDITQPTAVIDFPARNDTIDQWIPIIGYAYDDSPLKDFDYYGICYGTGATAIFITKWDTLVFKDTTEIRGDTLAIWNAEGLRGTYQLKLFARDTLGHTSQDTISIHIVDVIGEVKSRDGGYVEDLANNIEIYFPPNALPENTEIKISLVTDLDPETDNNEFRRYAGLAYDIMPKSITSKKPGTLSITYHDTNLVYITDERKLSIFRYNEDQKDWIVIGGTVYIEHNKITTAINQLGRYGLFEDLSDGTQSSIANIDCQPRVFSPRGNVYNTKTAISFELGKASNVTIKIYNTAGRLIRVLTQNEPMTHGIKVIDWDGREQQGNFCETGLCIVTIQAENKMESKTVVVLNK